MAERKSIDFWKEQIEKWNSSGLNQSEYCRQNNLNKVSFYKWRIKLFSDQDLSKSDFINFQINKTTQYSEIEFVYKEDFNFKLKADFDRELLKDVLEVIGGVKK